MDGVFEFLKQLINPESIIQYGGIYLLLFIVFAETGLFIGFFFPGDSLLFTSGLLCSAGILPISPFVLTLLIIIAAVAGNIVGYAFGKKVGPLLFTRKSGLMFRQEHLQTANKYYTKHGRKTIILSRFFPIIRTFAPIVAGIVRLDFRKFLAFSFIGAVLWVNTLVLIGYFLGEYIPQINDYLDYIVVFLIVITSIPLVLSGFQKKIKIIWI